MNDLFSSRMGDLQDPKMEVRYYDIGLYLGGTSPYIGLKYQPYISLALYGGFLKWKYPKKKGL